jgi:glucosamine-6-phosphate deaminase
MRQFTEDNYDKMCDAAAKYIADFIVRKTEENAAQAAKDGKPPKPVVLGVATGSTPIGVYKRLVDLYRDGKIDFSNVITFNLDEYIVDPKANPDFTTTHPESYHQFMERHLFSKIADGTERGMKRKNINIPETYVTDYSKIARDDHTELTSVCNAYEAKIKEVGGIDLQLVGIGKNGHLGFCEPGSDRRGRTSVVKLTDDTFEENLSKFNFSAPYAVSMGLGTIMEAKEILLIANGPKKAPVLKEMEKVIARGPIFGGIAKVDRITANVRKKERGKAIGYNVPLIPALALFEHPKVTAILDSESAASLSHKGLSTAY